MILRKKIASLLLVSVLCLGMAANADASEISETEKKAEELENQKKAAEGEKASLENQLNGILTEMDETKAKIEAKEIEVREKEEELVQAKIDENDQYESMKKRIKYMYENGNSQFIEILCESKSIGEFLNNAEYITDRGGGSRAGGDAENRICRTGNLAGQPDCEAGGAESTGGGQGGRTETNQRRLRSHAGAACADERSSGRQ